MTVRILTGDCRDVLRTLPDESVHLALTSPPYYGLRDYKTAVWSGGDPECQHRPANLRGARDEARPLLAGSLATNAAQLINVAKAPCGLCGATRVDDQVGLEATPAAYVAALVEVFREVRRILRPDGVCLLNLGDSYCSRPNGSIGKESHLEGAYTSHSEFRRAHALRKPGVPQGFKHKDLIGIPWRVALALQDDGWWLRRDIIWHKTNGMPESVHDRCTTAHEYLFHLTKSEAYFWDAGAIAEAVRDETPSRAARGRSGDHKNADGGPGRQTIATVAPSAGGSRRNSFARATKASEGVHGQKAQHRPSRQAVAYEGTRNRRSVWSGPTAAYSEAHFAVMPTWMAETCVLAGCPRGGVVLDPFGGAGTTALAAERLGRDSILIELNEGFAAMADCRIRAALGQVEGECRVDPSDLPLFGEEAA
jgi:DNA modification methylase